MRLGSADGSRRCACKGCSNTFVQHKKTPAARQKYCSPRCKVKQWKRDKEGYRSSVLISLECINGHERSPENDYLDKDGHVHCRLCRRIYQQRWRETHRETARALGRKYHARHRERRNKARMLRRALTK